MKKHGMGTALLSVILCVLMAGCAAAPELQQPTLEELLAGVNAKHQSVEQKPMDRGRYLRQAPDQAALEQYQIGEDGAKPFDPDAVITAAQAARDVEYLFGAFAALYGPYDYLGGAEVFDAHKAEILARCGEQESWTAQAFQDLLLDGLAFLPDAYFNINGGHTNLFQIPFFFRETDFYKTDEGYQTAEGKRVESVDNHPDLEGLFKPSISPEGEIVYYPILLEPGEWNDQTQTCSEALTIRYTDGSSETLTAEPFRLYSWENSVGYASNLRGDKRTVITDLRETGGIPVFEFDACHPSYVEEIVAGAAAIKDAPIAMLDLRTNSGGGTGIGDSWIQEYCGQPLRGNLLNFSFNAFYGTYNSSSTRNNWVENDRVLVVLTSKFVGSAAESIVDKVQDLENVILIGENTGGYYLTSAATRIQLPNSLCEVAMGDGLTVPVYGGEGCYFKEFEGFYPDLWVPAAEAETLAARLIQRLSAPAGR